ncbi:ParB/Srx family N-terminal domain-containing protein [Paraburkholderia phenoliruptrix]|uniref:ParB/Srx family N-terminal domain-containing protein n=1 Tax=Paraburkholderia phenoliruptrix TaxID=252970 RepID=UPI002855DE02|nr:ParB/Srx family N-terminal domain-containing protein [Paraburkholderia phenoliruptrix]MDR6388433.1 hypothetical protein [Paraburkholderia phenoliruptrix]WMY07444.1 ParB/Srx family N-terminal domain-containing protein [Paraburkholderia phenoliruptrix]
MYQVQLSILRPTQMTVGMDYVRAKAQITASKNATDLGQFMVDHAINVVLGPDGEPYVVDHHHWARAWLELGYESAPAIVVADWHRLGRQRFWEKMAAKRWVHPYDESGKLREISELPRTIGDLVDDPYHSLAAFARRAGAYRKPKGAYGSFVWSDFLRAHVPLPGNGSGPFSLALLRSIKVARSQLARGMPGYVGNKVA